MDPQRRQFDLDRLCEVIEATCVEPVESIRDAIFARVREWMVGQSDDMTVLVARYIGLP
jgi:serine phosphatase RsbU (regulator of sigma subunit)